MKPVPVSDAPDGEPLYFVTVFESRAVEKDWWRIQAMAAPIAKVMDYRKQREA